MAHSVNAISDKLVGKDPEQWEIDFIGNFLLNLYHRKLIGMSSNWNINISILEEQFDEYLEANSKKIDWRHKLIKACDSNDIGFLIFRCKFSNTDTTKNELFHIKHDTLMKFRLEKLNEYDLKQQFEHEVDEDCAPVSMKLLKIETKFRKSNIKLTSKGCYICGNSFKNINDYNLHIKYHYEVLENTLTHSQLPIISKALKLFHQTCKNPSILCIRVKTDLDNITIDKLILLKKSELFYIADEYLPKEIPETKESNFFVNTLHLSSKPILVVVYKEKNASEVDIAYYNLLYECISKKNSDKQPWHLKCEVYSSSDRGTALENYFIPYKIKSVLKNEFTNEQVCSLSNNFRNYFENDKTLTIENITSVLKLLLQMEDCKSANQYENLAQFNVKINFVRNKTPEEFIYSLKLIIKKGTKLQKHNLSKNDEIALFCRSREHSGTIENIFGNEVIFSSQTQLDVGAKYNVEFFQNRTILRCQYRALNLFEKLNCIELFLFPTITMDRTMDALAGMYCLNLHDQSIFDNPEQLQAVRHIAESNKLPAPYIVFGPPGTGKTATIVEAILQLYERRPNTRILIMAGSNGACDEIALRLLRRLQPLEIGNIITRIYSRSNDKRMNCIDESLLEFSNMYSTHFYPHKDTLRRYRIVICTLGVAGILSLRSFGSDNGFTHMFVDEVSACTESEVIMGICYGISSSVSLILSGDHKQLGPVLQSKRAAGLGLDVSLMERLLKRECYKVDEAGNYNHEIQTRLRRNYRSHPEIVELYSELYYNSELIAMVPKDSANLCKKWHLSPNTEFPILFHCVTGTTQSSRMSSSLSNQSEIKVVMDYVKELMYFGVDGEKLKEEDIGIISPYKDQFVCIQEQLSLRYWHKIECGTVETFQGKEKSVIIVSFVRSCTPTLGFLDEPRRLNVTLSRPKSLLILIGNPTTLQLSSDYRKIIETCRMKKTIIGETPQNI